MSGGGRARSIGIDPVTGKEAFVVARAGGCLEALADVHALEAAAVLVSVVGAVLEAGDEVPDLELAAFVPPLHAALEDCVRMLGERAGVG